MSAPDEPAPAAHAASTRTIIVEQHGPALLVRLNRPDKLNAINVEMAGELLEMFQKAETDRSVIAIVLTGNERAFCAGADLGRMGATPGHEWDAYRERMNIAPNRNLHRTLCFYTKPIISAVEGYCLGGGFELAMWGDFIVASETASFGLPEVARGFIPGGGGTQNLPRLIGPALAKELIWSGRRITAAEAREYRIVNHVVAKGCAVDKALAIVGDMARNSPLGLMMSKLAINRGLDGSRYNGALTEGDLAHMLWFSEDRAEGLQAFAEKRAPDYKGQ